MRWLSSIFLVSSSISRRKYELYHATSDQCQKVIVCLGQALHLNLTMPHSLVNRVDLSMELLQSYLTDATNTSTDTSLMNDNNKAGSYHMIFTGGNVRKSGSLTEAQAMWNYCRDNWSSVDVATTTSDKTYNESKFPHPYSWIPVTQEADISSRYYDTRTGTLVVLEEEAKNTLENFLYCKDILKSYPKHVELCIVTNEFHMPRASLLAKHILGNSFEKLRYCSAPTTSSCRLESYRALENRPKDVNEWYACERMDWEINGVNQLNEQLQKYDLPKLPQRDIEATLKELRSLQNTHRSKL